MKHTTGQIPNGAAGFVRTLQFALAFDRWARQVQRADEELPVAAIQRRWDVSRATAYRWRAAYRAFREADAAAITQPKEAAHVPAYR